MSHTKEDHYPRTPLFWSSQEEMLRLLSQAVNGLLDGQSNNVFTVALAPDETKTTVTEPSISVFALPALTALTASAAAAIGVYVEMHEGFLDIFHDSKTDTDRIFSLVLSG